jgi:hypothetical protein
VTPEEEDELFAEIGFEPEELPELRPVPEEEIFEEE